MGNSYVFSHESLHEKYIFKEIGNMQTKPNKSLYEKNQYDDAAFPVGMYVVTKERIIPAGRGYQDLHWHEELQFTLVTAGNLEIKVNGKLYQLEQGEAIFINKNLLHVTTSLTDDGRYISFNFPDKLLGFFSGSKMEQEDVLPYTNNYAFPATVLKKEISWQKEILGSLWALETELKVKERKNEYKIALHCTYIWYLMISNIRNSIKMPSKGYVRKQERVKDMLSYIHNNYTENIRLRDIAAMANVSEGECCRCFREMIGESPNQYLLKYRISRSIEMLIGSDLPITEIALNSGFNDVSHFIQCFKERTGKTPKEFRNQKC